MRILIADDHPAIRNGIKSLLLSVCPTLEFGEAGNGSEVIRWLAESNWTVLVLDVDMPGCSGFEVLEHIRDQGLGIPVLMFSFHKEEQIISRAFELGAAGYLTKDGGGLLMTAIRRILAGERNLRLPGNRD